MNKFDPAVVWSTGFWSGFAPKAPGTVGSVLAAVIWWLWLAPLSVGSQLIVLVAYVGISVALAARVMRRYQVKDAPQIVSDEFAGLWLALLGAPQTWFAVVLGFAAFRLFDVWKPWPVGWLDRNVAGAWGVMLDDLAAGLLSLGVLSLSLFWL